MISQAWFIALNEMKPIYCNQLHYMLHVLYELVIKAAVLFWAIRQRAKTTSLE